MSAEPTTPRGIRLAEIRARVDAATPGEWAVDPVDDRYVRVWNDMIRATGPNDTAFIAHARADVPFLLDELERALNGLDERREKFGQACDLLVEESARAKRAEGEIARLQRIVDGASSFTFGWFEVTEYDDGWEVEDIRTEHGTTSRFTKAEAIRIGLELDAKDPRSDASEESRR